MLADVDAGSDTPSLVGKVLKWRKENSVEGECFSLFLLLVAFSEPISIADTLWREIDQLNQSLAQTLLHITKLHDKDPENYGAAVKYISSLQPVQVRITLGFWFIHTLISNLGCFLSTVGS